MNKNGLIFLISAIAIALAFTWLNTYWLSYSGLQIKQKTKKIDYYLSDFTLLSTQPDGQMRFHIKAQHLIHQQSTGKSEIFKPSIKAQDTDGTLIMLEAKKADQGAKNKEIRLKGDVTMLKENTEKGNGFHIATEYLTYNPLNRVISTDAQLTFESDSGYVNGLRCFSTGLSVALVLAVTSPAIALKDDVSKPVHIDADSVVFNKSKGFATYEGNVAIKQGTLVMRAHKIEIKAPNNKIILIEAKGSPVSIQQKMDDGKMAKGSAKHIRYLVEDKRLILTGNAELSQNSDKFSSNHIEYSVRSGELKAGDKKSAGKDRVRAIFYPSNKAKYAEIVGLLGPNGAGKTTCFYMVVGLVACDKGTVSLEKEDESIDLTTLSMHQRARNGVGYLAQEASIFRKLTVAENIFAILETRKDLDKQQRWDKLESLLEEFQITHIRDSLGISLSGGERRRVEIARALATEPSFILLDEPFAGVDPVSVLEIQKIVSHLKQRGIGILITDHNVRETLSICDRAYVLGNGTIIAEGTSDDILKNKQEKENTMKLQTITFAALIALSGTASADWFDGFNNGNASGNGYGNAAGDTNGAGNAAGSANGAGNGWGTGKGDADGEVDFSITFKGKGKTNMDTAGNLTGNGQGAGNTAANGAANGNSAGNFVGNGTGTNNTNGSANTGGYAPAGYNPAATAQAPQQNYQQLKAMWEAQRKQADEMLKRIEAAQQQATPKS
ncbi:Lipopolysaccharide export system ATP-binding protein LptB [Nymphon striatum]|nr:Lipopolysaccharide export system ATP-binding protein LptB [Nymphon striatum]